MQVYKALLKSLGRLISEMTGMKAEVPADETKMVVQATIPLMKLGEANAWYPRSMGPVFGAAAGLSICVTATVSMKTAAYIEMKPAHPSQPIFENVRTEDANAQRILIKVSYGKEASGPIEYCW
jgi:hypothetical protein